MRLITDVLRDIRKGRFVDAASLEFASVVRDVVETGKPGEVTIRLKVESAGDNMVRVTPTAKGVSQRPHLQNLQDGMFFATAEGDLLRDDPERVRRFADVSAQASDDNVDPLTGEVRELRSQA